MSNVDRHLLLCSPLPELGTGADDWTRAIRALERFLRDTQQWSPWEIAEALAQTCVQSRLGSDRFSSRASAAITKAVPDASECKSLFRAVCLMSAAIRLFRSKGVRAERKKWRRDSMALGLWSALAFQRPLAERRLEELRADVLHNARVVGRELGRRSWRVRTVTNGSSPDAEIRALRWNSALHQEEIKILRWILADESTLLAQPYTEVRCDETSALARGLDLGLLLAEFPVFEHHGLASRDVAPQHETDLEGLLAAVGEDRRKLAAPFEGHAAIRACPTVFPLLTALTGEPTGSADTPMARSLSDWCGRALIESAIFRRSQKNSEGS